MSPLNAQRPTPNAVLTQRFYIPYGTLPPDALSYVVRQADDELLGALINGEFCYVLTSRQMGKSSLMVHTMDRLREVGVTVALLDLTALGFNLDAEQWYNGLLDQLGRRLNLQSEVEDYTLEQEHLSPLQRWQKALTEVVLRRISGPVVIFVDEIDIVRSLPFSTDEFFAAIRSCYNVRTEEAAYHRLTFCLLGVATPADLIKNSRLTPFDIGRKIHLNDFTAEEAGLLQHGLGRNSKTNGRLMRRILYWTGGHPCLTQRLCMAVAEDASVQRPQDVDRCCDRLFLTSSADHRDDNLEFVRQRLLSEEAEDPAGLLVLYDRVLSGKRVLDDETIPLIGQLKLSGVARVDRGKLQVRNRVYGRVLDRQWGRIQVRNRIYGTVFDRSWVRHNLPGDEVRRQKAAYRRGLLRSASIFGPLAAIMAGLVFVAGLQTYNANQAKQRAENLLYAADMNDTQRALDDGDVGHAIDLLDQHRKEPRIGWEWRYFQRISHGYFASLPAPGQPGHTNLIFSVAFSSDGKTVASASFDNTIKLWNVASKREIATLTGHTDPVYSVVFSPNGKILASASTDHTVRLWDVAAHRQITTLRSGDVGVTSLAFSPDGKTLAAGDGEDTGRLRPGGYPIRLWDLTRCKVVGTLPGHTGNVSSLAFSSDGSTLASGSFDHTVTLWNVAARLKKWSVNTMIDEVGSVVTSPDGRLLAAGDNAGYISLWEIASRRLITRFRGHGYVVNSVAFSPNGKMLASASWDNTVRLWNVAAPRPNKELPRIEVLKGHTDMVNTVAISPDGRLLATGGEGKIVRLWRVGARQPIARLAESVNDVRCVAFSPDGKLLASASWDRTVKLWNVAARRWLGTLKGHAKSVDTVAFSSDGRTLVSGSEDGTVKLWNVATRRNVATFQTELGTISSVAFSQDGVWLAASGGKGAVKLWRAGPNKTGPSE